MKNQYCMLCECEIADASPSHDLCERCYNATCGDADAALAEQGVCRGIEGNLVRVRRVPFHRDRTKPFTDANGPGE